MAEQESFSVTGRSFIVHRRNENTIGATEIDFFLGYTGNSLPDNTMNYHL
jgi:hypothetical protein